MLFQFQLTMPIVEAIVHRGIIASGCGLHSHIVDCFSLSFIRRGIHLLSFYFPRILRAVRICAHNAAVKLMLVHVIPLFTVSLRYEMTVCFRADCFPLFQIAMQ